MLVSLHLPKTAGTSFGAALERRFGSALHRDYGDLPLNTPADVRNSSALRAALALGDGDLHGVACVHGHFLPVKYLPHAGRGGVRFVTWMRHPVDRMVSHYLFWRRHPPPSPAHALHWRMHAEDWSLQAFCLAPQLRDVYAQFLWAFPLENFDFIGITEHFEADFRDFSCRYLDGEVACARLNAAPPAEDIPRAQLDPALRERIEAFHARDMALYARALEQRESRCRSAA